MKKFILIISAFMLMVAPASASCPIGSSCTGMSPIINNSGLNDKYIPNRVNDMERPNDFEQNKIKTYDGSKLQTTENIPKFTPNQTSPKTIYNNCQFGLCLP